MEKEGDFSTDIVAVLIFGLSLKSIREIGARSARFERSKKRGNPDDSTSTANNKNKFNPPWLLLRLFYAGKYLFE